jgi:hypothetical protein
MINVYEIVYDNLTKSIIVIADNLENAVEKWYEQVNYRKLPKKELKIYIELITLIGYKKDDIIVTHTHWKPFDVTQFN